MIEWLGGNIFTFMIPVYLLLMALLGGGAIARYYFRNFEVNEVEGVLSPEKASGCGVNRFWELFKYSLRHSILIFVPIICLFFCLGFACLFSMRVNNELPSSETFFGYVLLYAVCFVLFCVFLRDTFKVRLGIIFATEIFCKHGAVAQEESISSTRRMWTPIDTSAMFCLVVLLYIPSIFHNVNDIGLALLGAIVALAGVSFLYFGIDNETIKAKRALHEAVEEFYRELDSRGADGQSHGGDQSSRYQGPFLVSDVK